MTSRKRSLQAVDGDDDATDPSLLQRIRNMWQFANLSQWIYIFGKAAKIPESIDIEEIETECLKPNSTVLADIALALLKLVSSHRGLTHDIFDDQARKQFLNKSPGYNPFGDDETPVKFNDFDIFTKIRVLQQLTQWTMIHPERVREKMEEQKDVEQTSWRIEPYGWDAEDRTYFVLDDNRVYRLTEPPPASTTPKPKNSKNSRRGRRASKRRRTAAVPDEEENGDPENEAKEDERQDEGLGGMNWECLAVTLDDVQSIVDSFRKTRDENEKILRDQLEEHLIPILEKQEQARKRRELQRERELVNLAKMANAKRSSRIAGKIEQQKQEEKAREKERQHRQAEKAKQREEQAQHKLERERDNRMISREQRLREREARRLQHEEELAQLSEDSKNLSSSSGRLSERRRRVEIGRNEQALQDLADEEDWVFDCLCGLYGQVDDGAHSVACEKCNVWQHSKCLGIREEDADRLEFQFICASCTRREQERARPRPTIKLKLNRPGSSGGHPQPSKPPTHDASPTPRENAPVAVETMARSKDHTLNGGAEHGLPLVASFVSLSHGARMNVVTSSNSWLDTRSEPSKGVLGVTTPRTTQVIPAPIKLDAGYAERHSQADSPPANMAISTPMTSVKTPSPSNGIHSLQADKKIESALSTPQISRDIYRAAHEQNGTLPATGGYSPIKHSPPRPASSSTSKIKIATPILPPVALSPSPQHQVLTPPTKSSEPPRPLESR
ncbi:hypothetical protein ACJ41O_002987 [Fusarium nematophilum]